MKEKKTNAMRILDQQQIAYQVHTYPHVKGEALDGKTVAELLNEDPKCVFKTLVAEGKSKKNYVFVLPVLEELDLKKAAALVQEKSIELIPVKSLLGLTGYIRGGCSPIGMKIVFETIVHASALEYPTIIFSGGQIGCQIEMNPIELKKIIPVRFERTSRND